MTTWLREPSSVPEHALDRALTAQFVVAWAGESGEEPRLRWWRTDLVSEFGGHDLFKRLLPQTWDWAALQAVREAARRHDHAIRTRDHDADRFVSLFSFGFAIDERLDERLQELKRSGRTSAEALPGLVETVGENWTRDRFMSWVRAHAKPAYEAAPTGRRIKGAAPDGFAQAVDTLVAALDPLGDAYPLPHFLRSV